MQTLDKRISASSDQLDTLRYFNNGTVAQEFFRRILEKAWFFPVKIPSESATYQAKKVEATLWKMGEIKVCLLIPKFIVPPHLSL